MRRLALFPLALALAAGPAQAESLVVRLDQSARVHLSAPARDVVIGNPAVADVTMLGARDLVVLGKSYGVTNILVMDQAGRTVMDRQIVVSSPEAGVSYHRGSETRAYACAERCERIRPAGGSSGDTSSAASEAPAQNSAP